MKRKIFLLLPVVIVLSGCATPLTSAEMLPDQRVYDNITKSKYDGALTIGDVTVNKGVGGQSPVTAEGFSSSLSQALRMAGLYDRNGSGKYVVNAYVSDIDQPFMGFNLTVNSTVNYVIENQKTGKETYNEALTLPCSKTMSDAFNFEIRLRQATGCSIGENIAHFLRTISN